MRRCLFLLLLCVVISSVYADPEEIGYVVSGYGKSVKSAYGNCVHTAYYSAELTPGRADCGDLKVVASAPIIKPAPKVVTQTITISDVDKVLFEFNQAILTKDGETELLDLSKKISHYNPISVYIQGYTDAIGREDYNLELSRGRAQTVKLFLTQQGISANIITADGYGDQVTNLSQLCFAKYGQDTQIQIDAINNKLSQQKFKSKKISKKNRLEKQELEQERLRLESSRTQLLNCTAGDRRVVIVVKYQELDNIESSTSNTGSSASNVINTTSGVSVNSAVEKDTASASTQLEVPPVGQ